MSRPVHPQPAVQCPSRRLVVSVALATWLGFIASAVAQSDLPPFAYTFTPSIAKITVTPADHWGLFRPADTISIATSDGGSIRILDLNGNLIYSGPPKSIQLPVGHYFVETPGDRAEFGVLPQDLPKLSLIGVHDTGSWTPGDQLKAQLQPTWERAGAGYWSHVQTVNSNTWDWSQMDAAFQLLAPTGRKVIYLGGAEVPSWLTPGTDLTAYTNQVVQCWSKFVEAALQRYGNQIYAFEIWNEPGKTMMKLANDSDVTPLFLELARSAKAVRDRVAPQVKLLGPSWNGIRGATTTAQWLLDHGINDMIDIWSWHEYGDGTYVPDQDYLNIGWPPSYALPDRVTVNLTSALANKPLIVGELGIFGRSALGCPPPTEGLGIYNSGLPWRSGYRRAIKMMNMYQGAGVSGIIPHVGGAFCQYPGSNWEIYGFDQGSSAVERPRGPHPKTTAFLMTSYWLNNAVLKDQRRPGRQYFLYAWQRPDNTAVVFAWSLEGTTVALTPGQVPPAVDLFGRSITPTQLTEEPILFTTNAPAASALLQRVLAALPALNAPPVWTPLNNQSVTHDQSLQFQMTATDSDFDPLTYSVSPLPAGASVNAQTGVFSWTPGSTQMGSYPLTCTATDARGASATTATIITVLGTPTDGMVARWKFDETSGSTAADSARANTGTLVGFNYTPTSGWVAGRWGNALRLDGLNDTVVLNAASPDLNLTNNFTISLWVYPQQPQAEQVVLSLRSLYQASGLRLWIVENALRLEGQTTTGWHGMRFAVGAFPTPAWYHVVVMCDKSTIKVYVNGVAQQASAGANPVWGGDFVMNPTGHSELGGESYYKSFFDGRLDDVRFYSRCLSEGEITSLQSQADPPTISPPPPVNQPPQLNPIGPKSATEGQVLAFAISASDPNGDPLTYSASGLPSGATFTASTGTFSWTPSYAQAGSYPVSFAVSDGSLTASETITITVGNVNRAPVLMAIGNKSTNTGQTLGFTTSGSDPDGDALTYAASGLPSGATFNTSTHAFSWTPAPNQAGNYSITFTVSDGALTASEMITLSVGAVNHPPALAAIGNQSVNENAPLSFTINGSDPDNDALSYSASGLPSGATFNASTRVFSWTPTYTQAGSYNVTFTVSDGALNASQTVAITVANVNRAPSLTAIGNKSVAENSGLSFTVTGTDADGNALSYSASGLPSGATFNTATGAFAWTPSYAQAGNYNVTFSVSDGSATSSETITITVGNVDRPPVLAAIGNRSVNVTSPLSFTVTGSDPDGDALSYSASGLPSGATFNSSTHAFSWTPATSQAGNYSVTFTVSDGSLTDSETITVSVGSVNQPPTLSAIGNKTVTESGLLSFVVSGSDPDGDPLTYSATGLPAGASFSPSTRTFSWTPSASQAGNYTVVFTVSDGQLNAAQSSTITVVASPGNNTGPTLGTVEILTGVAASPMSETFTATDPENDPLTFSAADLPGGATLDASTGLFQWTPSSAGGYDLTASVSDGRLSSQRVAPVLVVDPHYDWLFGAKFYASMMINNSIFVCSFRAQGISSVVFVWTHPGVTAAAGTVAGMTRSNLFNQPITSDALSSSPMVYQAGKRVSPRQALDAVVAAIRY